MCCRRVCTRRAACVIVVFQIQKLKGLLAKQNTSLKALEREKAAATAVPVQFEILFTVVTPAGNASEPDSLWCYLKRWDASPLGPHPSSEAGAGGGEDKAGEGSGAVPGPDACVTRFEWQALTTVTLWTAATCVNKDMVCVVAPRAYCLAVPLPSTGVFRPCRAYRPSSGSLTLLHHAPGDVPLSPPHVIQDLSAVQSGAQRVLKLPWPSPVAGTRTVPEWVPAPLQAHHSKGLTEQRGRLQTQVQGLAHSLLFPLAERCW
jgi:hypothetical protein